METQKPMSALGMAVAAMCRPGGNTPEAQAKVVEAMMAPRLTPAEEKAPAIRLAEEKYERAMRVLALATRESREAELALHDLRGLDTPHTRWLRAFLENDAAAMHRAHVECAAQDFLRTHLQPPQDIAEEVATEVARIRNEQDKH